MFVPHIEKALLRRFESCEDARDGVAKGQGDLVRHSSALLSLKAWRRQAAAPRVRVGDRDHQLGRLDHDARQGHFGRHRGARGHARLLAVSVAPLGP